MLEILKSILFGIVEGVTEWLPISSTGHLILLNEFLKLEVSDAFYEMFEVVIQLGAILAVIVLFFEKLNPFSLYDPQRKYNHSWIIRKKVAVSKRTVALWEKVIAAVIPSAVLGLLLDDWFDTHFYNYKVVAIALVVYGVAFIAIEQQRKGKSSAIKKVDNIDWKTALIIGAFQCLALIPGTSRSGSTILGAILIGVSRSAAAEFSFFLAIPTMLGASGLKALKYLLHGAEMTGTELGVLIVGSLVSFAVSLAVIRGLMQYVRKHSFSAFGVYRIVLGILVLGYFILK